ncbi:hypothetical protein WDU94_009526 [Cyamophila willieti]
MESEISKDPAVTPEDKPSHSNINTETLDQPVKDSDSTNPTVKDSETPDLPTKESDSTTTDNKSDKPKQINDESIPPPIAQNEPLNSDSTEPITMETESVPESSDNPCEISEKQTPCIDDNPTTNKVEASVEKESDITDATVTSFEETEHSQQVEPPVETHVSSGPQTAASIDPNTEDISDTSLPEPDDLPNEYENTNNKRDELIPENKDCESLTSDKPPSEIDHPKALTPEQNLTNDLSENDPSNDAILSPETKSTDLSDSTNIEIKTSYPEEKETNPPDPPASDSNEQSSEPCDNAKVDDELSTLNQLTDVPVVQKSPKAGCQEIESTEVDNSSGETELKDIEEEKESDNQEKLVSETVQNEVIGKEASLKEPKEEIQSSVKPGEANNMDIAGPVDTPDLSCNSFKETITTSLENEEEVFQQEKDNSLTDKPSSPVQQDIESGVDDPAPSLPTDQSKNPPDPTEQDKDPDSVVHTNKDSNIESEDCSQNINGAKTEVESDLDTKEIPETLEGNVARSSEGDEKAQEAMEIEDTVENSEDQGTSSKGISEPMEVDDDLSGEGLESASEILTKSENETSKVSDIAESSIKADEHDAASDKKSPDVPVTEEDKSEPIVPKETGKNDANVLETNIQMSGHDLLEKDPKTVKVVLDIVDNNEIQKLANKTEDKIKELSVEVEKNTAASSLTNEGETCSENIIIESNNEISPENEKVPKSSSKSLDTNEDDKKVGQKIDDTMIYEKFECKPLTIRADINMEELQKLKSAPKILGESIVTEEETQEQIKEDEPVKITEVERPRKTKPRPASERLKTKPKITKEEVKKIKEKDEPPKKTKDKEELTKKTKDKEELNKKPKDKEDLVKKTKEKEDLVKKTKDKEDLAKKTKEKGKEDAQKKIKEKVVEKPVEEDKPKIKCKKMDIQETKKDVREPSKRLIIKSQSSINESVQSNKKSTPLPQADGPDIEVMDEKYTKNPMRMYEVCKELKKMARNQSLESSIKLAETKKVKKVAALKAQYQIEELTPENIGSLDPSPKSCDGCKKIKPTTVKMDEPGKIFLFCSLYCGIRYKLRRIDTTQNLLKRRCCGQCNRVVVPDDKSLSWKTTNFCDEKCLTRYQQSLGDICGNCNTHIPVKFRGRYIFQRGTLTKIFCSAVCRAYHKSANKYCAICCKVSEGSRVMIVGDYKICSQDCLKKFSSYKKTQGNMACCTVCHLNKPVQYDVLSTGDALNHLCSEKCFKAFNFVNKLDVLQCNLCEKFFDRTRQEDAVLCFFDDLYHNYCSRFCYQVYVSERSKKTCAWCKGEKNELSMIRRVYENQEYFYCTLNCLNMLNVEKMVTAKSKQCDYCKAYSTDTFYISAYSATKSFCTYKCVYNFHNNVPLISDVRSLVAANVSKTLPPPAAPAPKPVPPAKPARVVPNKIIKPKYEVTKILPKIIRQILIKPQEKKEMKNAATQVKPTTSTKRVSCKTTSVTKECQTGDDMGRPLLIPVPVPIYIPSPAAMYSVPFPVLIPVPIPIPVPVFIPTTRNSAAGIFKEIKRIQEKIPADPFEAELLMMAEMVASDKKDEGGTTDDDSNAAEDDFDNEGGGMETSNNAFGEDVLQMAIKMACNDLETPSGGLQAVDLDDALQPATITITQAQRTENNTEDIDVQDAMFRGSNRGRKRGSNNKAPMSRAPPIKRQRRTSDLIPQPPQAAPPPPQPPVEIEKPDANMCLKYTFGVNAWRQWVINKNLELEKAAAAGNRKPNAIKLFKPEILQLTADELNFSLCLFVKEVRKPNGTQYAPDTIYYLCLGIQQYLFESGRIDNIFTDPYYEKFTEALDEVCCKFSALYNDTQFIVTRVEEEHLWESKQLGAHSPHVLLNTLMFFNTKHFNLITVEEHMQLSFSHIMKHWKRNPGMGGANIATNCTKAPPGSRNVLLRFYPPQSAIDAPGSRKKKVYEQQENEENPLRCPVRLYEFYLSKCPESVKTRNDVFYLLPERSCVPDSPVWYSTTPLNKEALMKMLHRIKMVKEINIAFLSL